ncbi:hypothetical protein BVH01_08760 [Pseudomonas sp. PA1(2017)]|nr:hypothetical protein BVH01_08760 [Pseudomonas sp. PA1(2017)]
MNVVNQHLANFIASSFVSPSVLAIKPLRIMKGTVFVGFLIMLCQSLNRPSSMFRIQNFRARTRDISIHKENRISACRTKCI